MYDSRPRPAEGEPIEEVLPAAINATATTARGESQKASRAGGELARRPSANAEEPRMAVMRAGSPAITNVLTNVAGIPGGLLIGAAVVVLALVAVAVVLI